MRPELRSTGVGLCVIVVVLLSACSNTSSVTHSKPPPTVVPRVASATPPSAAMLRELLLNASDMPAGWAATPHKADPKATAENAAQAACLSVPDVQKDRVADVYSPSFALSGANVTSEAISFRSEDFTAADVASLRSTKWASCLNAALRRSLPATLPSGMTITSLMSKATSAGTTGILGYSDTILVVSYKGGRFSIYSRSVYIDQNLHAIVLTFTDPGQPFPTRLQQRLTAALLARSAHVS